ncbi:MAG: YchJ family protein [Leptolyngbyaceae cyanobacterium]
MLPALTLCPCGSQRSLMRCCGPYLAGQTRALTAEALMRSRYTAYCQQNIDYLVATHHPTKRALSDRSALRQSMQNTTWLGLTILNVQQGQPADPTGVVEFVARFQNSSLGYSQIHERSQFKQQKGRWFYLDGEQLPAIEPQRNEPCWCGSGKKYKQCHG